MKKIWTLFLTAALALSLTACGGDKHNYNTDLTGALNITTFDMTQADAVELEESTNYELENLGDSTLMTFANGTIYRFSSKNGTFEFVKWTLPDDMKEYIGLDTWEALVDACLDNWTDLYGEPEYNEDIDSYSWYGKVNGDKAQLVILKGISGLTPSLLELDNME